jgi:hypothetical protein
MDEQTSDYSLDPSTSSWPRRKAQGLVNRYHWARRGIGWAIHRALHPISIDFQRVTPGSVPILINNFNRLEVLREQLDWILTLDGELSIVIMDNASTYPPLLDFYASLDFPNVQVLYLGYNSCGNAAKDVAAALAGFPYFVLTDPDVLPYATTPRDVVPHLRGLLERHRDFNHVGLSLEIDDLPEHSPMTPRILAHESAYWAEPFDDEAYVAPVDTTFAMYRADSDVRAYAPALRTRRPYTLRHVDWYRDPSETSQEYAYYLRTCRPYATWATDALRSRGRRS